jgi:hypothetical protein
MRLFRIAVALGLALCLLPLVSTMAAGLIASHYGCQLNEGSVHPCVIGGQDRGSTLYTLGMMGWFMIATLPIGAGLVVLWLAVELIRLLRIKVRS